jgi:two-component system, sporulation sensor kinase B
VALFLLNLLSILIGIFIYLIFLYERKIEKENRSLFIALCTLLAIVVSKQFPVPVIFEGIFEFIYIPFLLGSIYGGRFVAIGLFLALTVFNFFSGEAQILNSIVIQFLMLLTIVYILIPKYTRLSKLKKMMYLMSTLVIFSCLSLALNVQVVEAIKDHLAMFFWFSLIEVISLAIIIFISEYIRESTIIEKGYFEAEKLRVVSELAASVSHEVKNPLTVTRGFIQLLNDPNLDKKKRAEFLQLSLQELDRAQEIITSYLTLANPTGHVSEPIINLTKEIDYITKVMNHLASTRNVEINIQVIDDCYIVGDQQKLRQCLINIIKNAIEAIEQGGTVTIVVESQEGEVIVSISDTGIGMSKEQIASFGLAYQSTKDSGTGLGLLVVHNIIRAMQGKIEIDSEVGKGTTFNITFNKLEVTNLAQCPT